MEITEYQVGDQVRIVLDSPDPEGNPVNGHIVVVQDVSGKQIGVELRYLTKGCHSLDGLVEERTDEARGITYGRGWWTRPENIEKA